MFLIYPGDYDPAYRWVMAGAFLLLGLVVATEWKPLERIFTGLSLVAWVLFGLFAVAGAVRGCPTNCV